MAEVVVLNRMIWAVPWVYVYLAGAHFPWWVRPGIVLGGVVALAVVLSKALRRTAGRDGHEDESLGSTGVAL